MIPRGPTLTRERCKVTRVALPGMLALRANLADRSLMEDLGRAAGQTVPPALTISQGGEVSIAWMAPDEVLIFCPESRKESLIASLRAVSDGAEVLITDVSDMRIGFELQGGPLREILARITPADVSAKALPVGRFRRSKIGQVAAAFWLSGEDRAHVIAFRSVADYVEDVLKNAAGHAAPLGIHHATN
jgi:sarcosine oxidase, subunit gamma